MADPNGWPDASKPGVPMHPERDGCHWFKHERSGMWMVRWIFDRYDRTGGWRHLAGNGVDMAAQVAKHGWRYLGPCLTPAEVAAREAAAFQAGATSAAMAFEPAVIARALAEAERSGMERAAEIVDSQNVGLEREDCSAAIRAAAEEIKP